MIKIGIEWEPQFTILQYPKAVVHFVVHNEKDGVFVTAQSNSGPVYIALPTSFYKPATGGGYEALYVDGDNLEASTKPLLLGGTKDLERFEEEIDIVFGYLKELTEIIAEVGDVDVGIFLPKTPYIDERGRPFVTKHISISPALPKTRTRRNPEFTVISDIRGSKRDERVHFKVPYHFNQYLGLSRVITEEIMRFKDREAQFQVIQGIGKEYIEEWADRHPSRGPIFLGSSRRGRPFVTHHKLI